ncbi:hypothetical protein ASG94_04340 [Nocardioides sp. Soil805]|nr:hypothetical protein ASG94_04340 [Nocardioides sp. Soil805]
MLSCVLLAGCGGASDAGDEPITPGAIAAVTQDVLGRPARDVARWDVFTRELGQESPGATMRFGRLSVEVAVAPTTDSPLVCADPSFFDECVQQEYDGHEVTLAWQELEPEEDPGVVYVIDRRDGEDVVVGLGGPTITGDPRDLDLGIDLADLAAVATDPRLGLTTTPEVVDQGAELDLGVA